jgi:hypothetical protein
MLLRYRRAISLIVALSLMNSVACYTYAPLAPSATPRIGERVRMRLTPQGMDSLARFLGPRVASADGQLSSVAADGSYVVAVDFVQTADGIRQPWNGEGIVSFPQSAIVDIKQNTFQKKQTFIATAIAVGALLLVTKLAFASGLLGGDGGAGSAVNP